MSNGYTKLFASLITSTVWQEPDHVRIVWIAMLALAGRDGVVEGSVPGLAHMARVSIEQCEDALERFMAPDRYSRTKEHDGRRVEVVDGGWRLLNHGNYRARTSAEEEREKAAERKRRERERERAEKETRDAGAEVTPERDALGSAATERDSHAESRPVTPGPVESRQAEAEAEAEADPSLRSGGGGRASAPTHEPPPRPVVVEHPGVAAIAESVWQHGIVDRGGKPVLRSDDARHFRAVAEAADGCRGDEGLRTVLERWFREWVATRRNGRIRPEWWAEWAVERAARGVGITGGWAPPRPPGSYGPSHEPGLNRVRSDVTEEELARVERGRGAHA